MSDKFSKLYEDMQRQSHRRGFHRIWTMVNSGHMDELPEEDYKIAKIMLEHEEYHNQFAIADHLVDHKYDPDTEENPFIHIDLHYAVEGQLETNEPMEAGIFLETMEDKGYPRHDIIHIIGMIITRMIYDALCNKKPFDLNRFMNLLTKFKNMYPGKIPDALEREFMGN